MLTVPLSALSQPDDSGKDVMPEVGDTVDLSRATAVIKSIDGDKAEISMMSINDAMCDDGDGPDSEGPSDDDTTESAIGNAGMEAMKAKLMKAAASQDMKAGY
jgi:hypothetical protein